MNEISNPTKNPETKYVSKDLTLSSIQSILRYHYYSHEDEYNCKTQDASHSPAGIDTAAYNALSPTKKLQSFQSSSCYRSMQQGIGLIPIENLHEMSWKSSIRNSSSTNDTKSKNNNGIATMKSFSLFDIMDKDKTSSSRSSSTTINLQIPPNIRDILDETDITHLLTKCSTVKLQDIILGINTTQDEVKQLGDLLLRQLLLNHTNNNESTQNKSSTSFLQVHLNWMEECMQHEECHSFSFVLLRNVSLYLHSIPSNTATSIITKECYTCIVHKFMKMISMQFQAWNDTSNFQTPWLEIVYLLLMLFQRDHDGTKADFHKTWIECEMNLFENMLEKMMACISSFADVLFVCADTDFIRYLLCTTTDPEKGSHARQIFRTILLQSSVWTFPYPNTEKMEVLYHSTKVSLETLPSIEFRLCQRYSTMENGMKNWTTFVASPDAPQQIASLLQPFLLHYPLERDSIIPVFLHIFESCAKDMTVLHQVLSLIFPTDNQDMHRKRLKTLFDTLQMNSTSDQESQRREVHLLIEKMLKSK